MLISFVKDRGGYDDDRDEDWKGEVFLVRIFHMVEF